MMTWQPIGPEQMDGRMHLASWENDSLSSEWVRYNGEYWTNSYNMNLSPPTHYLPGVRPLGEAEAPREGRTVRARIIAFADENGNWAAYGGNTLRDEDAKDVCSMCVDSDIVAQSIITADLPIPTVRDVVAKVEAE